MQETITTVIANRRFEGRGQVYLRGSNPLLLTLAPRPALSPPSPPRLVLLQKKVLTKKNSKLSKTRVVIIDRIIDDEFHPLSTLVPRKNSRNSCFVLRSFPSSLSDLFRSFNLDNRIYTRLYSASVSSSVIEHSEIPSKKGGREGIRGRLDIAGKEDSLSLSLAREGWEEEKEGQGGEYLEGKKSSKLVCSAQQPAGGTKGE